MLAIRCHNLVKRYSKNVLAVDGLDLEIEEGECFGLLGPNGAGKTTTIEILEGILKPTSGDVEVLGRRWDSRHLELRQEIGISLQETRLSEKLSVRETLKLFRSFYDRGLDPDETIRSQTVAELARMRREDPAAFAKAVAKTLRGPVGERLQPNLLEVIDAVV